MIIPRLHLALWGFDTIVAKRRQQIISLYTDRKAHLDLTSISQLQENTIDCGKVLAEFLKFIVDQDHIIPSENR